MDQPLKTPTTIPERESQTSKPAKRRRGRPLLTILILVLLAAGAVWWLRREKAPQQDAARAGRNAAPMSVVDETIGKGDIGISLNALGTVSSLATVTIRSQISGYLMKIDFKEGDEVKKGDLLAEIDSRTYEAALAQAKG